MDIELYLREFASMRAVRLVFARDDLVMRASSLLAFRCYFELPSINKDFTSLHFRASSDQFSHASSEHFINFPSAGISLY